MFEQLKQNLFPKEEKDEDLLRGLLAAAVNYAEKQQNLDDGYYATHQMAETTRQAVIMLASHWYESRDGGTGGFFANTPAAAESVRKAVDSLLALGRTWKI